MRLCVWCATPLRGDAHPQKVYCSASRRAARCNAAALSDGREQLWREAAYERKRRKPEQSNCQQCGSTFSQTHKRRFCSKACSSKASYERRRGTDEYAAMRGEYGRRRRARRTAADVQMFTAPEIFERDGWRCHICRRKVRRDVDYNHDLAPTIDHLQPLSLGGAHSRANVATAHRICNSRKSSHGAGDQLALIG